jgi:hypothetical protein
MKEKKIIFLAWVSYDGRSALMAQHMGAKMIFLHYGQRGKPWLLPFRYLVLTFQSIPILIKEKPDIIYIQVPPLPTVLLVYVYCLFSGAKYIMDTHSCSYTSVWSKLLWLLRWFSHRALVTIVHNTEIEQIVAQWGCKVISISYIPGEYQQSKPYPVSEKFNIAFVCSFSQDEPIQAVLEAAAHLPDVTVYITGNVKRATPELIKSAPQNCHFTGFLSLDEYLGLLENVDAIMDLTTEEHTVLLGGFEAITFRKPFITSDTTILRNYFSDGVVHVSNTSEGIRAGIRCAQEDFSNLQQGIHRLKAKLDMEWANKYQELIGYYPN